MGCLVWSPLDMQAAHERASLMQNSSSNFQICLSLCWQCKQKRLPPDCSAWPPPTLLIRVTGAMRGPAGSERNDSGVGEVRGRRCWGLLCGCSREPKATMAIPGAANLTRQNNMISKVWKFISVKCACNDVMLERLSGRTKLSSGQQQTRLDRKDRLKWSSEKVAAR